jgi:DNA polymerase III delta prime subunit
MEKKIVQGNEKEEGEMKPYVAERGSHPHTHMAYMSGPAGVGNDSTTPNSTTGNTTHAGAFM